MVTQLTSPRLFLLLWHLTRAHSGDGWPPAPFDENAPGNWLLTASTDGRPTLTAPIIATVILRQKAAGAAHEYGTVVHANHVRYAVTNGYDYATRIQPYHDDGRDIRWAKVKLLASLLSRGWRWAFWTDADSLFNCRVRLEDAVATGIPLAAGSDDGPSLVFSGDQNSMINSGQLLMRNSSWSRDFLSRVWSIYPPSANESWHCKRPGEAILPEEDQNAFQVALWEGLEQRHHTARKSCAETIWQQHKALTASACASLLSKLRPSFRAHVRCVPQELMNSYDSVRAFRVHVPGDQKAKLERLTALSRETNCQAAAAAGSSRRGPLEAWLVRRWAGG